MTRTFGARGAIAHRSLHTEQVIYVIARLSVTLRSCFLATNYGCPGRAFRTRL